MKSLGYERPIDPSRSELMRRVRQQGTAAENEVADVLRGLSLRFRRNVRRLPGSPDFANHRRQWAVFVHGCFWHRHRGCVRTTTPTRNRDFWLAKFDANVKRDQSKQRLLRAMGFVVVTVWECETRDRSLMRRKLRRLTTLG
ncbi:MAG: very short patch repair endonuclease [Propylenella sp.]